MFYGAISFVEKEFRFLDNIYMKFAPYKVKISSSPTNLRIFFDFSYFNDVDEILKSKFAKQFDLDNVSIQKFFDFIYNTPLVEAWWKGGKIYSEFMVGFSRIRKVYDAEKLELFIYERLVPLEVRPGDVFDFLKLETSDEISYFDSFFNKARESIFTCELCLRDFYSTEVISIDDKQICVFCYNNLTPQKRREIEDGKLFMQRISETWKLLSVEDRKKIVLAILRESRKPTLSSDLLHLKSLSEKVSNIDDIYDIDLLSGREFEKLVYLLDVDYFNLWWKKCEMREIR